ncbi:MAG: glycosyltransferase family 4 protein [Candidatus Bathyarchaeota archaeon]|nr:MAG: glycosyltransferase family 4 protein [Candidatus Bathyarchaeota archaeon]
MKIAMVTKQMLFGYGIDEVVHILSREMARRGYEIDVITSQREVQPDGYQVIVFKPLLIPFANSYWQTHFLQDFRSVTPITRILKDYDVTVTFDPMHLIGAIAKLTLRVPIMAYYFGVVPPNVLDSPARRLESMRQRLIWNTSFVFADCIMTNSKHSRGLLPKHLRSKAIVNYHGIEHIINRDTKLSPMEFKEKLNIQGKKLILSVARFSSPYKNMSGMVRRFKRLKKRIPNIALLLVGRGSPREIKPFCQLEDTFVLANISNKLLRVCFASCDVYCSTSLWEGYNIPLVAAQTNGKPVVAYRVGAHSEVVADKITGFLAETDREFDNYLADLLENEDLRKRMGREAAEHAKKFTWDSSVEKFEDTIRKVSRI